MAHASPNATSEKNTCVPILMCTRPVLVDVAPIDNIFANMDINGDGQNEKQPNGDKNARNLDFNQDKKMGSDECGSNTFQPRKNDRIRNKTEDLITLLKIMAADKSTYLEDGFKSIYLINEFFEVVFKIKIIETEFSLTDKNILGPLIADLLQIFGLWVSISIAYITEPNIDHYKIRRSGLEFFLEEYKNFPDGKGGTLELAFKDFRITEDIEGLDEMYNIMKNCFDPERLCYTLDEFVPNAQQMEHVPRSHWWWWS